MKTEEMLLDTYVGGYLYTLAVLAPYETFS